MGSPAEKAGLIAGDSVVKVNNTDVYNLRHKDAQDVIVKAGQSFELTVQRGGSTWKPSVTPTGSVPRPTPVANNISPVTKTSLAAKPSNAAPIGAAHNLSPKGFNTPHMNGDGPKLVNKQYNSPMAMYSEESIAETLSAQAEVLSTGALGVNFKKNEKNYDPAHSEVFKMLHEVEKEPRSPEPATENGTSVGVASVPSTPVSALAGNIAGLRHVTAPENKPAPATPQLPPGQNICADCERLIVGVFVRIKDKNLHVECFKCATCGASLKNVGYYNINNKLYCDIHAKLAARSNPPAPNMVPVTVPPGGKVPVGTISAALSSHSLPSPSPLSPSGNQMPAPFQPPKTDFVQKYNSQLKKEDAVTNLMSALSMASRKEYKENGTNTDPVYLSEKIIPINDFKNIHKNNNEQPSAQVKYMPYKPKTGTSLSGPKPFSSVQPSIPSLPTTPTIAPVASPLANTLPRAAPTAAMPGRKEWPPSKPDDHPSPTASPLYIDPHTRANPHPPNPNPSNPPPNPSANLQNPSANPQNPSSKVANPPFIPEERPLPITPTRFTPNSHFNPSSNMNSSIQSNPNPLSNVSNVLLKPISNPAPSNSNPLIISNPNPAPLITNPLPNQISNLTSNQNSHTFNAVNSNQSFTPIESKYSSEFEQQSCEFSAISQSAFDHKMSICSAEVTNITGRRSAMECVETIAESIDTKILVDSLTKERPRSPPPMHRKDSVLETPENLEMISNTGGNPGGNVGNPVGKLNGNVDNPGESLGGNSGNPGENPGGKVGNPGGNPGGKVGNPGGNPGGKVGNPGGNPGGKDGNPGGNPGGKLVPVVTVDDTSKVDNIEEIAVCKNPGNPICKNSNPNVCANTCTTVTCPMKNLTCEMKAETCPQNILTCPLSSQNLSKPEIINTVPREYISPMVQALTIASDKPFNQVSITIDTKPYGFAQRSQEQTVDEQTQTQSSAQNMAQETINTSKSQSKTTTKKESVTSTTKSTVQSNVQSESVTSRQSALRTEAKSESIACIPARFSASPLASALTIAPSQPFTPVPQITLDPVPLPEETVPYIPPEIPITVEQKTPKRSDVCRSPFVEALTTAPDREYSPIGLSFDDKKSDVPEFMKDVPPPPKQKISMLTALTTTPDTPFSPQLCVDIKQQQKLEHLEEILQAPSPPKPAPPKIQTPPIGAKPASHSVSCPSAFKPLASTSKPFKPVSDTYKPHHEELPKPLTSFPITEYNYTTSSKITGITKPQTQVGTHSQSQEQHQMSKINIQTEEVRPSRMAGLHAASSIPGYQKNLDHLAGPELQAYVPPQPVQKPVTTLQPDQYGPKTFQSSFQPVVEENDQKHLRISSPCARSLSPSMINHPAPAIPYYQMDLVAHECAPVETNIFDPQSPAVSRSPSPMPGARTSSPFPGRSSPFTSNLRAKSPAPGPPPNPLADRYPKPVVKDERVLEAKQNLTTYLPKNPGRVEQIKKELMSQSCQNSQSLAGRQVQALPLQYPGQYQSQALPQITVQSDSYQNAQRQSQGPLQYSTQSQSYQRQSEAGSNFASQSESYQNMQASQRAMQQETSTCKISQVENTKHLEAMNKSQSRSVEMSADNRVQIQRTKKVSEEYERTQKSKVIEIQRGHEAQVSQNVLCAGQGYQQQVSSNLQATQTQMSAQQQISVPQQQTPVPQQQTPVPQQKSVEFSVPQKQFSTSQQQFSPSQNLSTILQRQFSTPQSPATKPAGPPMSSFPQKPYAPQMPGPSSRSFSLPGPNTSLPKQFKPSPLAKSSPTNQKTAPNVIPSYSGPGSAPAGRQAGAGLIAPKRGRGILNLAAGPGTRIPLCGHCNSHIRGPFITALGKIWCPEHFICTTPTCRRPLQDMGFVEERGQLYCEYCFEQYLAPVCSKCNTKIKGDCLNAIGKHFHPECFTCAYCSKLFGNSPFFLEDGLPYCEADWNELFTTKCFACGFPVEAGDRWVEALSNNYHSQCFNCTMCKKNLEGQSFYAKGGRPFCKNHAR